ncbi:M1 family metallopeptidase [Aureibaculum sp. A20]|uniref:M1 family metallopeptidase n=1 Tax=Aureibaculum flavum TaxID=2795986 RepID=A0ABS0WVL2_9FLAO|nr:M1 family metallopeptidase [Aureibaculum flavum]MBJ2175988.1 M1 family metallopeptidase [Aureibaculum flavum]
MRKITSFIGILITFSISAQNTSYWQQHVDYTMSIDMNVENYQYDGTQKLIYTNNSPDALGEVFYHLQFNAFQPGSDMDIRLQNIKDPDRRMVNNLGTREAPIYESRIAKLKPDEIGYIKINSLQQDGVTVKYEVIGTLLKVKLNTPIMPGGKTVLDMNFKGQVPLQIRRSGRNSEEGIALSMTQWYPKLAEYDFEGWQTNQYIAREFHGVWGDFDVKITIDKEYTIGGTGYLQNPNEIGHGYSDTPVKHKKKVKKLTWHFKAPNVHDFTWAADPDYIHDKIKGENDVTLHFFYKNDKEIIENWKKLQPKTAELLSYYNTHIGQYPYKQYSVIQGGDGGMEYAMCTLITGGRNFGSLVGVTAHEFAHTWFQFLLATNETKHEWMDEGFTSYISSQAMNEILNQDKENPNAGSYRGYIRLAKSGVEEPLTTLADHYTFNYSYSNSAYSKGAVFLAQLGYIIGKENLEKTLKKYFEDFKFKHPTPNDIKRTAEKVSGIQLDWYLTYFTKTTATIDYAVDNVDTNQITLKRIGKMPMPIDLKVTYTDGTDENFYIPLKMMLGSKPTTATPLSSWSWTAPTYSFSAKKAVKSVEIDPSHLMADIDDTNNNFGL